MTEQEIKSIFEGKTLTGIELYAVDGRYLEVTQESTWIVHAGIQMKLDNETYTFGWHETEEITTFFSQKIMEMSSSFSVNAMGAQELEPFQAMMKNAIKEVEVIGFDATYDDGTTEYLVESLIFKFDNDQILQVAGVDFQFVDEQISNITYNYQGGTLVSITPVEIGYAE